MCPANDPKRPDEAAATEPRLSLEHTPRLRALVEGPDGAEILQELKKLVRRDLVRATRYERNLLARIRVGSEAPPEIAVVRDLSKTGVRLELAASAQLDVIKARAVTIEMRLPGSPFVSCEATLVRVSEHHSNGVELAFAFAHGVESDPAFAALLGGVASAPPHAR